ncbi:TRAP transporter substrate-binding protein [Parasphingorhabdus halotolerans]|uniref:TRAP transporter substrate-binding protein n=1 Tax=Parasphingorhabdus halotolerans TaxID=2725558 RepID=A0A6H2DPY2_9SPHN|nr:TRAP transporter substrate-binding protein [Parasphingorhabdus halotolerans]QJB70258.1 TRAP transporter substrate-binding protein [Parasphingorhabdus halotolerans]
MDQSYQEYSGDDLIDSGKLFSRRKILGGAAATALLAGCKQSSVRTLRAAEFHPPNYPTSQAILEMGRLMGLYSNGTLGLKLYAGSQLGSERDTLELTTFGGIDINRVALAPLNSIEPMTSIPALPFIFNNVAHMRAAMDGAPGQTVMTSLERHGLIGLCYYDSGARSFYNTKKPIRTPEDMAGMKLRVQNSDLYISLVEALGANPTPMPLGEVYQSLVQGVVDGAENNWPSYFEGRHFEVAKYYSLTRHVIAPEVLIMSAQSWHRLSEKDQEIIQRSAKESVPVMRELWDAKTKEAQENIIAAKVAVNEVDDKEAFVERMKPVWDEYVQSPAQKRLVDEIREMGADHA